METIRRELTIWFAELFKTSMQWVGDLVPSAEKKLTEALELANANNLLDGDGTKHEIDINLMFCSVSINGSTRKVQSRVGSLYQKKTYSEEIHPVPDREDWKGMLDEGLDEVIINPPKVTPSGAHSKKRQARPSENGREKRSVHCSRCKGAGHYRKTCLADI
ncbi:hypothetical protein ACFE04_028394 [Oxalis oulophora]